MLGDGRTLHAKQLPYFLLCKPYGFIPQKNLKLNLAIRGCVQQELGKTVIGDQRCFLFFSFPAPRFCFLTSPFFFVPFKASSTFAFSAIIRSKSFSAGSSLGSWGTSSPRKALARTDWESLPILSFFSLFIDAISISFSNSNYKYEKLIVNYFINKSAAYSSKFYFVMIFKARELRRCVSLLF